MFLFPQAKKQKNKPAPGDFWELLGTSGTSGNTDSSNSLQK